MNKLAFLKPRKFSNVTSMSMIFKQELKQFKKLVNFVMISFIFFRRMVSISGSGRGISLSLLRSREYETKRSMLSQCAKLFDPLVLVGPVIVAGKIFT